MERCVWCGDDPLYVDYHDNEWGVPEHDDRALFEKLCLDGFQAGLSWITILRKRDAFRRAFRGFDPEVIARFDSKEIATLLGDASIIRSKAKIVATIANARAWLEIMASGPSAFDAFLWKHVDGTPIVNHFTADDSIPANTVESHGMAKDLKKHGFSFVGPTICYAFMQATGMVNDHVINCPRHIQVQKLS